MTDRGIVKRARGSAQRTKAVDAPAGQSMHCVLFAPLTEPGLQLMHCVAPSCAVYVSGGQMTQVPVAVSALPAGHAAMAVPPWTV